MPVELTVAPIRDLQGWVTAAATVCRDITQRKRAEATERMLIGEINHRSNNLLAIIQAIAHRSFSGDISLAEARQAFEARLQALTRINQKLTESDWSALRIKEIVRQELEPFVARAQIEGVDITLNPQDAQNFALALHELATNAAKYGALANGTGSISISWTHKDNVLKIRWRENGGPLVAPPTRRGFGTALLDAAFRAVNFDYAPEGLNCEFEVPLKNEQSFSTHEID